MSKELTLRERLEKYSVMDKEFDSEAWLTKVFDLVQEHQGLFIRLTSVFARQEEEEVNRIIDKMRQIRYKIQEAVN